MVALRRVELLKGCGHLVIAATLAALLCTSVRADDSGVTEWPLPGIPEPSGVTYHSGRGTLFVVGDQGDVGEVALDGRLLASRHIGGDLEGIAWDTGRDVLYVVREGADVIVEVSPADLRIKAEIPVDRAYGGDPNFLRAGGDGLEGIAFVPPGGGKASTPGGVFVVNQFDPPVLAELEMGPRATIRHAWKLPISPLSDVVWDPGADAFLIVSAIWRKAEIVSPAGEALGSVSIPGFLQEGLARLPDGSFVIAQDSGGLLRWKPSADPFAEAAGRSGRTQGADSQGGQQ